MNGLDAEEIPSISDGTDHTDAHESSVQTTDEEMEEQTTQITQYYRSKSKDVCIDKRSIFGIIGCSRLFRVVPIWMKTMK